MSEIYDFYPPLRGQFQWIVGANSEAETRQALSRFTLRRSAERIECPLLILYGEDDLVTDPRGAKRLFAEARCEKDLRLSKSGEPGSTHCTYNNHAKVLLSFTIGCAIGWFPDWQGPGKAAAGRSFGIWRPP